MGTTYAIFEARIRQDLSDSGSPPLLSAADLDRHIDHAARDLALVAPVDLLLSVNATPGSRALDLTTALAPYQLIRLLGVEWPVNQYPQEFVQFNLWGDASLTLLVEQAPAAADAVNLYCQVAPVVTGVAGTSTVPARYDDLVALGAAGYAAQELAARLVNQINIGGPAVWQHYLDCSTRLLAAFNAELRFIGGRSNFHVRRLYSPEYPPQGVSQTEVYPPETFYP